jgi:hypothetical protein
MDRCNLDLEIKVNNQKSSPLFFGQEGSVQYLILVNINR